ncbi:MAG: hypothetical protein P8Y14_27515, partial [Anaerolineales bacterium]
LSLDEYIDWVHDIYAITRSPANSLSTFHRYAPEEITVEDPTPLHILLDLLEVEDRYITIGMGQVRGGEVLQIENKAFAIEDNQFVVTANGVRCEIQIKYDQEKKKYWLTSPVADKLYTSTDPNDRRGLIDYLNREQSFRVIPRSENAIYVLGEFYRPIFKVGREFNPNEFDVSKILFPCEALGTISSEKTPVLEDGSGWSNLSLFGIIDELGESAGLRPYFGDPELLVCDDMGTEIADFILADSRVNKVVFIHAKANRDRSPYSASKLQDVCAQATKNINYIGMYNEETPPGLNNWEGAWSHDHREVAHRIRRGEVDGIQAWSQIRQILRHPLADREVWLFLGQMLSKQTFEDHLARRRPTPEALQSAFLLHASMTNVASVGARLRVFCYP